MELQRNTHHVYHFVWMPEYRYKFFCEPYREVPKMLPSDVMQIIKNISAREFFRLYPDIKKRYFGGW